MKTIITADACVNHNGSFKNLVNLAEMVSKVNMLHDASVLFKVQKRNPSLYSDKMYNSWVLNKTVPYNEHKMSLEFSIEQYKTFDHIAKDLHLEWYCSVFDFKSLEDMRKNFSFKYWKIASPVTADMPQLVEEISKQDGVKIISTGMCKLEEIDNAIDLALKHNSVEDIILLHCTSMYPCPNHRVNLQTIQFLKERYNLKIGYSSHDTGVPISVAAVALGACAIEKHITLDRAQKGPDHALSLGFRGLETLIRHIKAIEKATGCYVKQLYDEELSVRNKVRLVGD